jgi:branched-chain amino acid aminotransferase
VDELVERAKKPGTEAALSGTAAVLTSVGTLIHNGEEITVGSGEAGATTQKLRQALNDIQWGKAEDKFGWLQKV